MPLNNRKLHIIDFNDLKAHLWYDTCGCNPVKQYIVQDGENIILHYHNNVTSEIEPDYITLDEEGNIVKPKPEICI